MISIEHYRELVRHTLGNNLDNNPAQSDGVNHKDDDILMIVAGPGSGKTSVLVLRALRHVFVDAILPEQLLHKIFITLTFPYIFLTLQAGGILPSC